MASKLTDEVLDASQDLPPTTELHRTARFPRRRTTPRKARTFVVATLTEWGETSRLDDMRLCASELVTNAVLHGTPAGRLVLVRVDSFADHLVIEVHDAGDEVPAQRAPEESDVDGRGLLIVSNTADRWGVKERKGPGKCVWAEFDRAGSRVAPESRDNGCEIGTA
ncbi:ATP-binding protein [Streptomyces sp. LaPpAH-108]|uniref:ATP-binding protein n=1 Tax=Streptomyces sp. LaPpAH-108 TaxID=1155714 RepID=UPI00036253AE|nr:ATP-binding protein [Streptomyces sp. LaPpAH-108]